MFTHISFSIRHWAIALFLLLTTTASALTSTELQQFIDEAIKAGGGEVVIPPGRHIIERTLIIKDAKKLRVAGLDAETTILQLPHLTFAELSTPAKVGDTTLTLKRQQSLKPSLQIQLEADGEIDSFTQKPKPYQLATIQAITNDQLTLKTPLKFPAPAGTFIRDHAAPNIFEIRGTSTDVSIGKLTLDGGRIATDPPIRGHAQLCGILAQGTFSYEAGPTGPRIANLFISRCFIQNCHGRGIALYAVENSRIEDCTIRDTSDEAIDLDHFTQNTLVRHNHLARSLVGVELNDASACRIEQNDLLACRTGIHLWRYCKQVGLNEENIITANQIDHTTGNAIQLGASTTKNTVSANIITHTAKNGITLSGTGQILKANQITDSKLKDISIQEGQHAISP